MSSESIPAMLSLTANYEILRELGRGGTAVVYLARDRATGAEVAIKLIHARYAHDVEAVARFAREARFVAQLEHPNVVQVHTVLDLGDGGIALVMAHVAGRTLKQRILADGPLSPVEAEGVMRDVAFALGAAHALGIVHRDVKPENIFLDADGRALLADFGVARSMSTETQQLTMHGVAIGTPSYMAPEQIEGGALDGRGDIYSLGLVAWEMLSGRRPWDGEALYAVLYHQKHDRLPSVRELRTDVPPRLADAIDGAMEKERESRWQNTDELLAALDGAPPARRAPIVAAASTDTVRFARVPVAPAPVAVASAPVAIAAAPDFEATAVILETMRARMRPSRGVLVAGALVSLFALILLTRGVQAWTDSARRRSSAQATMLATMPVVVPAVVPTEVPSAVMPSTNSAGIVEADSSAGARPSNSATIDASGKVAASDPKPFAPLADTARDKPPNARPIRSVTAAKPANVVSVPAPRESSTPSASTPVPAAIAAPAPPLPTSRTRIVTGGRHTCLLGDDDRGFCWGGNDRGQLGTGSTSGTVSPMPITFEKRFIAVAPGLSHSCAIDANGATWCWGENERGQLGDRTTTSHAAPARVYVERRFRSVTSGAAHSCALDTTGSAWCWGANGSGQLGDGSTKDQAVPVAVATSRRFISLDAGWNFTCGLDTEHRALCWGDDRAGQLGDGATAGGGEVASVLGRQSFTSISAGSAHACGVTSGGEAYCWGANSNGQLGNGSASNRSAPTRVSSETRFVAIAAGAVHTCALSAEGASYCWGRNTYGQLGDGSTDDRNLPVRVAGGHAFTSIRSFGSHTCGATASGEAFCWGYNSDGQLGDGTRTHRARPVYVERPGVR